MPNPRFPSAASAASAARTSLALSLAALAAACGTTSSTPDSCVGADCVDIRDDATTGDATTDTTDTQPDVAEPDAATDAGPDTTDATDTSNPDVAPDTPSDTGGPETEPDAAEPDAAEPDATPDVPVEPAPFRVSIAEPRPRTSGTFGENMAFLGYFVSDTVDPTTAAVQWYSDIDGFLSEAPFNAAGESEFSTDTLSSGLHRITLEAFADGFTEYADITVGICAWPEAFPFDEDLGDDWEVLFDATRDSRGWLEMTGNIQGRKGAIVNTARPIAAGDVRIRFDVSTGQCFEPGPCSSFNPGADGFAVSIFDTGSAADTVALLQRAASGGGLGYGVGGEWGDDVVDAFHIELDTWHNVYNGTNEFHTDPTDQSHLAITLNGDPGNHVVWAPLPTLEDNEWHSIEIVVTGSRVRVSVDDELLADEDVDGLAFKGGYLAFTGSTGYYTNHHRFDNLSILESCSF